MNAITVEKDRISEPTSYGGTEMDPGRDAWELLKRAWMTDGPGVITLPVDPIELCDRIGIVVLEEDELDLGVSVVLRKESGFQDPEILLRPNLMVDRRRFICAHAIGHYSRNTELRKNGAWHFVDGSDLFSGSDPEETYATEFAFELLTPRAVLKELDDSGTIGSLASFFGVTGDVMGTRLDRIGWRR